VNHRSGDIDLAVIKIDGASSQTEQFALTKIGGSDRENQESGYVAQIFGVRSTLMCRG